MTKIIEKAKRIYKEKGLLYLCRRTFTSLYNRIYNWCYPLLLKIKGNKTKIYDLVIYLNPDDKVVSPGIFRGNYEVEETKLFKDMLSSGLTVIDIGANIGYYTLIIAKQVGRGGQFMHLNQHPKITICL